ncbi:MAG: hypothetical protein HGA59_04585 [Chlorobiaceae bacterium]|jgi:hypothetical protein|nr:hypothetical protein [Chlorobiaceae bacterium]NTV16958.1 hypothetical protein [Chlorobiaceae bacterium]
MEKRVQIGIQYSGFRFKSFSFNEPVGIGKNETFNFDTSMAIKTANDRIIIGIMILVNRKSDGVTYAKAETESLFLVKGLEQAVSKVGNVNIPEDLLFTIISLAISTSRGALMVKGAGTFLEKIPMPIIDPKSFFHK